MTKNFLQFKVKIVSAEKNGELTLQLDKKQKITIAKKFLPKDAKIGDKLIVEFYTEKQFLQRQKNLAEAVLKEILE